MTCERTLTWERNDLHVRIETRSELSSTAVDFLLLEHLEVFEEDEADLPVVSARWSTS